MAEDLHQKALNLELKKRYIEAGEVWEACGQVEKAVANYHRSGNTKRAIDLALKKGLNKRAAELYVKAEIFDRAAELFRKERDFGAAARAYRQGGLINEAAVMFETAGEFGEAARLYESVNDFVKAGELYEKGGDLGSSAKAYEMAIDGKTLDRLGGKKDMARVAQVLTRVKNFEKAAEIYARADEISEAVLMFVRMGEVEGAAKLLSNCHSDVGFEVLSKIDYNSASALEFARMFYVAHDYGKAARIFEACRDYPKAAYLYEKNGDYHQAGETFGQAGDALHAAEMFEKAGSHRDAGDWYLRSKEGLRAAACFEAADDHFQAGRLYFEAESLDKSIGCLQKVGPEHARYLDAGGLTAEVLRKKGYPDLAKDRYLSLLAGLKCDPLTVEHFYNLAGLLMERQELDQAERCLNDLVAFKFGYRDVAARLEEVRRLKLAPPPVVAPAPAPIAPTVTAARERPALAPPVAAVPPAGAEATTLPGARVPPVAAPPGDAVVARMDGFDVLAATPLFEDLSLAEMKRFWEVCEVLLVRAGDVVFEEGLEGRGLYIVRKGAFSVIKAGEILVQLHAGEFFGEMSLMDQTARTSARVAAAADGELFFLDRTAFHRLIASSDATALKMYRVFVGTLCERLRRVSDDLAGMRAQAAPALEAPDA